MKRDADIDTNLSGEEPGEQGQAEQRAKWYKRFRKGITTSTADKKETAIAIRKHSCAMVPSFAFIGFVF